MTELLIYPQAAQRLGGSTRDVQRMVRTEQLGYVLDARGRRRMPSSSLEAGSGPGSHHPHRYEPGWRGWE